MIKEVIGYILIFVTAFPTGYILAKICKDELIKDKKYILALSWLLLIVAVFLLVFNFSSMIIMSLAYMALVFGIMLKMSKNRRFMKNR